MAKAELNILFTCAGRRVALLEAFRAAMGELDVAGRLIAADVTAASPAYHKADVGVIVPKVGEDEYVGALLEQVARHRVGLLVPLTDLDLRMLAGHSEQFADAGCTVMIGSADAVDVCQNKIRTNELVAAAGLTPIRTVPLAAFVKDPFYPCFIKPVYGSAAVGTGIIESEGQLHAHVGEFGNHLLVQEFIPGQEFTIDVYRSRDRRIHAIVPRQRLAVRSGEVEKGVTVRDESLAGATTKLLDALGDIWGVFCCQCRRSEDGVPRFFEINPRFGGGAPLSIAAGANLPLYLLQEVLGREITGKVGEFTDRLMMLRYDDAVFVPVDDGLEALPGYRTPEFR